MAKVLTVASAASTKKAQVGRLTERADDLNASASACLAARNRTTHPVASVTGNRIGAVAPVLEERNVAQAATFLHSSAQALRDAPMSTHSLYCGNLSYSFLQARHISATVFASRGVNDEFTDASDARALQAAIVWKVCVVQSAMLLSFIDNMPKQWRRPLSPSATHFRRSRPRVAEAASVIGERVDLVAVAWTLVDDVALLAIREHKQIEFVGPGGPVDVRADPMAISAVIDNALRAEPAEGLLSSECMPTGSSLSSITEKGSQSRKRS